MTVVVLGVDALDPQLVDAGDHPALTLDAHRSIETIVSAAGSPSTHELWPTIITGLTPEEHGLQLDDGVAWENSLIAVGSDIADHLLPDGLQSRIGAWILNNTAQDAFRTPSSYYEENGLETVFDDAKSLAIGVPNYVVEPEDTDREHELRKRMGDMFERDPGATTGHVSEDPAAFYEQCLEMAMVRVARVRRGLRGGRYGLVFGYTSGLDLIGHIAHDDPGMQSRAYDEIDDVVGELRDDLGDDDELVLVSDHGLRDGLHTDEAMIASTSDAIVEDVESVVDVREVIEREVADGDHAPSPPVRTGKGVADDDVADHLEELGYM